MQTSQFLQNTDYSLNSRGYIDVIAQSFAYYVNTAGAVTAANTLIAAITSERNNVHTLLGDGITEVAPTIVANGGSDDGGKLRYITKGLIDAIEANIMYPGNVDTDPSIAWGTVGSLGLPLKNVPNPPSQVAQTFKSFSNPLTMATYGYTANTRTRRAATIAAVYALYAAVASL